MNFDYPKLCFQLLSCAPLRAREILTKRFGLAGDPPETLEAVGKDYNITRERVRQIVEEGLRRLKAQIREQEQRRDFLRLFGYVSDVLNQAGSVKREDKLVDALRKGRTEVHPTHIIFLLHIGEEFLRQRETEDTHPFWANDGKVVEEIPELIEELINYFEEQKKPATMQELFESTVAEVLPPKEFFPSYLELSKHIMQGPDGSWGLRIWPQVNPRGVREKAFLALHRIGKPMHFSEVARLVDELQESLPGTKKKKCLPQTVHNEMIKDPRFVLVGRGMYGLVDWGLRAGTVKEVISQILQESGNTLSAGEIVARVLQERKVKPGTILLNLQDRNSFARDGEGRYRLSFSAE